MTSERTCCFTGHRILENKQLPSISSQLRENIESLIHEGFSRFTSGGALGFDLLAAQTVLSLKKNYPQISLHLALPCRNQESRWNEKEQTLYRSVLSQADEVTYLGKEYHKDCMLLRNRYMVDHSACVIAYLKHFTGGTKYTVSYAAKKGVKVLYLNVV